MNILHLQKYLRSALSPLGSAYAALMQQRRKRYMQSSHLVFYPSIPCISVGNIAWGGTGKTPLTNWLLTWAKNHYLTPAVLTRGYGGKTGKCPLLVTPTTAPSQSGDEPLMLACKNPQAHIIAFPQRAVSARYAQSTLAPQLFILDDGMQHLAVHRDINLVLLRPEDLTDQWNCVIPQGSWREGKEALAAASAFCMKIRPQEIADLLPAINERLAHFQVPLFTFSLQPESCIPLSCYMQKSSNHTPPNYPNFANTPYVLTTGVGNPQQVEHTAVAAMGTPPTHRLFFDDHHTFTEADIHTLTQYNAPIVCTEKDAVKLHAFLPQLAQSTVLVLTTSLVFGPMFFTQQAFTQWLDSAWNAISPSNNNRTLPHDK